MSENTFWLLLWLGLASVLCGMVATINIADAYRDCVAMQNGYVRRTVPGCSSPVWTKDGGE